MLKRGCKMDLFNEEKKKDLKALVKYGQLPLLDIVLRKDSVFNALSVPEEVIEFVEKL